MLVQVSRPADMTEFGAEWVKAYEKDSWTNVTNEYEPYTFNDFGSKIPLQEFRSWSSAPRPSNDSPLYIAHHQMVHHYI